MTGRRLSSLLFALALCACREDVPEPSTSGATEPSPNASILPQPLASAELRNRDAGRGGLPADSAGRLMFPEASTPPPEPVREDRALPRDTLTTKDSVGVTLEARFAWADVPGPAGVPEVNADSLQKARDTTALAVTIDLGSAGRMRVALSSVAFPLPKNTEIRASNQYFGHVLVWPDGRTYRVLLPGSLRALLSERRVDVAPLALGKPKLLGKSQFLGLETERMELKGPLGTIVLEQATQPIAGASGALLCRMLLELVAIDPHATLCDAERTPLKAEFRWPERGRLSFDVMSLTRRADLPIGQLFFPPAGAEFKPGELPPQASGVLLTQAELLTFRTRAAAGPTSADAPGEGIAAVNRSDVLRYVLLDGVPIAWVKPRSEQYVIGPQPGRYAVSWRDFLGTEIDPAKTLQLPARVVYGAPAQDAGDVPP